MEHPKQEQEVNKSVSALMWKYYLIMIVCVQCWLYVSALTIADMFDAMPCFVKRCGMYASHATACMIPWPLVHYLLLYNGLL